jgi:hypothetical protein
LSVEEPNAPLQLTAEKKVSLLGGASTVPVHAAPVADGRGLKVAEPSARSVVATAAKPGEPITAVHVSAGEQAVVVPVCRANCAAAVAVSMMLLAEK